MTLATQTLLQTYGIHQSADAGDGGVNGDVERIVQMAKDEAALEASMAKGPGVCASTLRPQNSSAVSFECDDGDDGGAGSLTAQLQQLAALHASGALTSEEFAGAKRRLLGNTGGGGGGGGPALPTAQPMPAAMPPPRQETTAERRLREEKEVLAELRAAVFREGKNSELGRLLAKRLVGMRKARKNELRHQNRMARLGVQTADGDSGD